LARLFISHSSTNNAAAVALRDWLFEQGFENEVFLDVDPDRGLAPGDRWQDALKAAADRCEAVLVLVSPAWLASGWCLAEFLFAKSLHKRIFGLLIEPTPLERLPREMTSEWQLCELVGDDQYRRFDVRIGAEQTSVKFREAGLQLLRRGLERAGLDAHSFPWPPAGEPNRSPYRGLRALEPQDAAIFFGRDAVIVRGLDRIRGLLDAGVERFLVILGASGSGKSSFLRAGLWPRLARDDAAFLPLPAIRPESAVMTGNSGLAVSLFGAFDRLGARRTAGAIKELLREGPAGFASLLDELSTLARRRLVGFDETHEHPTIVIAIDQAEELFNVEGAAEASVFLDHLAHVLAQKEQGRARRVLLIATIRSDRYELLQAEPRLSSFKRDLFDLPSISPAEFKSVIEGPAHRVMEAGGRLAIEPALTEKLVADAQGADALPLLGFTLERLYADYGDGRRLTLSHYEKIGGVQGSIEAAVAQTLADPDRRPAIPADKEAQFAALRAAFIPALARIDRESGVPMRRTARLDEIRPEARSMIERLVNARLLVADRRAGADVVEVAHESLLRQWPALASWLETDAEDLKILESVERAAGEWARDGRLDAWLDHRAERLAAADRLVMERDDFRKRLGQDGVDYLAACRAREEKERQEKEAALAREKTRLSEIAAAQARTARFQRIEMWTLAATAVLVVLGLVWILYQRNDNLALQSSIQTGQVNLAAEAATSEQLHDNFDGALRLAAWAAGQKPDPSSGPGQAATASLAQAALADSISEAGWDLTLTGHSDWVTGAAYSPDGRRIATASKDGSARIWDAATGKQIMALSQGHWVTSAAFSADGRRLVTASSDGRARVWDAATGRLIQTVGDGKAWMTSAAFDPTGDRIVTASRDKTARIWDAATGKQIVALLGHTDWVTCAAFSPDGRRVVTASRDRTARIWDAATGREITSLVGHEVAVWSASYSHNGKEIVTASDDSTARIWDAATGRLIHTLEGHEDWVRSAAFSPDDSQVVTGSYDNTIRLWKAADGSSLRVLQGHEAYVEAVAFSPDGRHIVSASDDDTARIWDVSTGNAAATLQSDSQPIGFAVFSPDGKRVITSSNDDEAHIFDVTNVTRPHEIGALRGHSAYVETASYSPDEKRIVTASYDDTARIWDAATGQTIRTLTGHDGYVESAVFSNNGKWVVTASDDGTARIWNAETGAQMQILHVGIYVDSAAFSPDDQWVVTASDDDLARIWQVSSGKLVRVLRGHEGYVEDAEFSPDGKRVVTASYDDTAIVWDAQTGKPLMTLRGHQNYLRMASFSPDGARIVTASSDRTARVWDAATGDVLAILRGHSDVVNSARYSPDGAWIVTASYDGAAKIWDARAQVMSTQELREEACKQRLGRLTTLTHEEMHLGAFPDASQSIDACSDVK
jgi:WD40 repeat protein